VHKENGFPFFFFKKKSIYFRIQAAECTEHNSAIRFLVFAIKDPKSAPWMGPKLDHELTGPFLGHLSLVA